MEHNHGENIKYGICSMFDQNLWQLISLREKSMVHNQCQVKIYGTYSVLWFGPKSVMSKKVWVLFMATMVLNHGYILYLIMVENKTMGLDHGQVWD